MRAALSLTLALSACAGSEVPVHTEGTLGFEVLGALALVCPPDMQGQFIKVFVEGTGAAEACDMDLPRPIPLTCEDRRAYLDAVPQVCLGAPAAAGANLPMMDLLLEEVDGAWTSFDYAPVTHCHDGAERTVDLYGPIEVGAVEDGEVALSFDLATETGAETLSGSVSVAICED